MADDDDYAGDTAGGDDYEEFGDIDEVLSEDSEGLADEAEDVSQALDEYGNPINSDTVYGDDEGMGDGGHSSTQIRVGAAVLSGGARITTPFMTKYERARVLGEWMMYDG